MEFAATTPAKSTWDDMIMMMVIIMMAMMMMIKTSTSVTVELSPAQASTVVFAMVASWNDTSDDYDDCNGDDDVDNVNGGDDDGGAGDDVDDWTPLHWLSWAQNKSLRQWRQALAGNNFVKILTFGFFNYWN